jgi:peptidoglycan hydrolase CwlO-like protein
MKTMEEKIRDFVNKLEFTEAEIKDYAKEFEISEANMRRMAKRISAELKHDLEKVMGE